MPARLAEPLRIAVAGMVKAGKSTLLNAIIGEEIAPTDTGECTRIVTWYRYGHSPRITLYPVDGEPAYAARSSVWAGGWCSSWARNTRATWSGWKWSGPRESLRDVTLIDTPGIASLSEDVSARSVSFLTPRGFAFGGRRRHIPHAAYARL